MRFLFSMALFCLTSAITAQTQTMLFEKSWAEPCGNLITYVDELPNGDLFLVGGRSFNCAAQAPDPYQIYACRIDASGTLLWEKDWGDIDEVEGIGQVTKCSNGTYMIPGWTGFGLTDMTVANINADGTILFYRSYTFSYADYATNIIETPDSCFIVAGTACTTPSNFFPAFLKIDRNGNEIWRRTQNTLVEYSPAYVSLTPDNGYIILGRKGSGRSYYAKYDSTGVMQWINYSFGMIDTLANTPSALRVNSDGTFDICYAVYYQVNPGVTAYNLFKHFDVSGNCLTTSVHTQPISVLSITNTDSSVWGVSSNQNLYIFKHDSVFRREVGLNGSDTINKYPYRYISTADEGYVGIGQYSPDPQNVLYSFYLVKFGPDGRYHAEPFSESVNAYPNPSIDGNTTLTFDMAKAGDVQVSIYTTDGKVVYAVSFFCQANSHTELPVRLGLLSASGGMYILQARTADAVIRKKLVVRGTN